MSLGVVRVWSLVVLGATSNAAPLPVDVDVEAPSGCADSRAFFERLHTRMERVRLARAGEEAVHIEVRLSRSGAQVHGVLRMQRPTGEAAPREVDGASCEEVLNVLSLTAALALEHEAAAAPPEASEPDAGKPRTTTPPGDQTGTAAPSASAAAAGAPNGEARRTSTDTREKKPARPPPSEPVEPAEESKPRSRSGPPLRVEFGAQVGIGELLAPLWALGSGVQLRGRLGDKSVGLSSLYWSNKPTEPSGSTDFHAFSLGLSVCPAMVQLSSRWALEPCALASLGAAHVFEASAMNAQGADRFLAAAGALGRLRLQLSQYAAVELEAGLQLHLVQRRFITIQREVTVAETPAISPTLCLTALVSP